MDNHFIGCLELNLSDNIQERVLVTPWEYFIQLKSSVLYLKERFKERC